MRDLQQNHTILVNENLWVKSICHTVTITNYGQLLLCNWRNCANILELNPYHSILICQSAVRASFWKRLSIKVGHTVPRRSIVKSLLSFSVAKLHFQILMVTIYIYNWMIVYIMRRCASNVFYMWGFRQVGLTEMYSYVNITYHCIYNICNADTKRIDWRERDRYKCIVDT
jgi:hypothetical protein